MTTVFERVSTALSGLNVPYANQVYIPATGSDLPDLFLVYTLITSGAEQHADNVEKLRSNQVQVSIYSRTGLVTGLPNVDAAMVAAGFQRAAKYQLPYSRETKHFGLALDFTEIEES
jgi:hypothetical protein